MMSCRRPGLSSLLLVACPDGGDRDPGAATRVSGSTAAAMAAMAGPGVTATGDVPTTASPRPWGLTPPAPSPG